MRKNPRDKESGLPKAYVKGLSPSTAKARKAHWDRANKLSDRDPRAYEPAPGDANAKTVPSKATREIRKIMNKEEVEITEEAENSLAAKAKKFNVPLGTLKTVYRRGVAAWNSGHRPGTTAQQWGHARVNSYLRKGKGTYHGADKDLRKEEVQIDEISKDTMKSYKGKALNQYVNATVSPKYADHDSKEHKLAVKRMRGMNMADKKMAKEETQLDELSSKTLYSYSKKAGKEAEKRNEPMHRFRGRVLANKKTNPARGGYKLTKVAATFDPFGEEVAVNSVGAGNVAGLQGEPPVHMKKKKKNVMSFSRFMKK